MAEGWQQKISTGFEGCQIQDSFLGKWIGRTGRMDLQKDSMISVSTLAARARSRFSAILRSGCLSKTWSKKRRVSGSRLR